MTRPDKKKLMLWNSILWVAAMALPGIFSIAFESAKFPWPVAIPFLLFGPLLASNGFIARAAGDSSDEPATKEAA